MYYPKKFFKTHDRVFKELEEKKDAIQRKKDKEISKKIADLWEQRMQIPQYHYENNDYFNYRSISKCGRIRSKSDINR